MINNDIPKVSFLVCGTQKGGTTALHRYLSLFPEILLAKRKEVHFFDNEAYFKQCVDYNVYHNFFDFEQPHSIAGELTPIYMYWKSAPRRIYKYNPQMKLIFILRNPIERAYSHWNMEVKRGNDTENFTNAIRNEALRVSAAYPLQHRIYSYVDRGFYSEQLERFYKIFPKENIYIMFNEELKTNPKATLASLFAFLQLEVSNSEFEKLTSVHSEITLYKKPIQQEDYKYLLDQYTLDIDNLASLLNVDLSSWKSDPQL